MKRATFKDKINLICRSSAFSLDLFLDKDDKVVVGNIEKCLKEISTSKKRIYSNLTRMKLYNAFWTRALKEHPEKCKELLQIKEAYYKTMQDAEFDLVLNSFSKNAKVI